MEKVHSIDLQIYRFMSIENTDIDREWVCIVHIEASCDKTLCVSYLARACVNELSFSLVCCNILCLAVSYVVKSTNMFCNVR